MGASGIIQICDQETREFRHFFMFILQKDLNKPTQMEHSVHSNAHSGGM